METTEEQENAIEPDTVIGSRSGGLMDRACYPDWPGRGTGDELDRMRPNAYETYYGSGKR
jgi:hypothetical protein